MRRLLIALTLALVARGAFGQSATMRSITDAACALEPCTATSPARYCLQGTMLYACDTDTGFYVPVASGAAPAFNLVTSGTNTTATMTVGTGASIVPSGTGVVTATRLTGSGSTTNNVDLATAEVAGTLPTARGGTNHTSWAGDSLVITSSTGTSLTTDDQLWFDPSTDMLLVDGPLSVGAGITMAGTLLAASGTLPVEGNINLTLAGATVDGIDLDTIPRSAYVINVCPSGCVYADLAAACTAKAGTSDATHPVWFVLGPGVYTTPATCPLLYGGITGAGPGLTQLDMATPTDTAIDFGTTGVDLTVSNLSIAAKTGIKFQNASSNLTRAVIDNVHVSNDAMLEISGTGCLSMTQPADNSTVIVRDSRCTNGRGAGWVIGKTNGLISIYSFNNIGDAGPNTSGSLDSLCTGSGTPITCCSANGVGTCEDTSAAWWSLYAVPKLFVSHGDTFSGALDIRGPIAYSFQSDSGAGYAGGRAYISAMSFDVSSIEDDVAAAPPGPVAIQVNSGASNLGTLIVSDAVILGDSPNATAGTNADGVGIYVLNATTKTYIHSSYIRNTASYAGPVYDIYGTTTPGNIVVGADSDWLVDNGILVGDRSRNPRAAKPASCTVGDRYIDNSAGAVALCLCTATGTPGTWEAQGAGTCN